jgi:aspartyl-tRNA(Asn)/glutamyl-tRNA(Gln) amidotransferase subunit A
MTAVPPRIDDDQPDLAAWDAIGLHMIPENLFGVPAVAVRAGFDQGLPVGVQIAGREGADATVLAVAEAFVQATPDVQRRRPEL